MGKYTNKFTPETVEDFLDCYEDAQESIVKYLKEQLDSFDFEKIPDDDLEKYSNSILNFYQELPDAERIMVDSKCNGVVGESREISFISFNYTDTFKKLLDRLSSDVLKKWRHGNTEYQCKFNTDIIYAHGTVSEFPIIGVNDESQIANKALLNTAEFKNIMIKSNSVAALGRLWHKKAEEQISQSRIVCVFGMSLGETDAKWWRKIALWLKADSNRHLIIYWYVNNPPNGISVRKQLQEKNKVITKLLSYSNFKPEEINSFRERIHTIINTGSFLKLNSNIGIESSSDENSIANIAKSAMEWGEFDELNEKLPQITVV